MTKDDLIHLQAGLMKANIDVQYTSMAGIGEGTPEY